MNLKKTDSRIVPEGNTGKNFNSYQKTLINSLKKRKKDHTKL